MRIVGHGVDLVENARIERMVDEHGSRFLERVFTPGEVAYADDGGRRRIERLSGRFAVKEAALKALGTGWRSGIAWTDFEVTLDPMGRPSLRVGGEARRIAADRGIGAWLVSLSHTETHAIGSAIAVGDAGAKTDHGGGDGNGDAK
ncbi:MAG: holo-ACP synthase [Phycisphaerales bacterium]